MSKFRFLVAAIAIGFLIYQSLGPSYERPAYAQGRGDTPQIESVQFDELFANNTMFSDLAEKGQYTVIEGYLPTCAICKRLEAGFPAFLSQRSDVVIRKVQLSQSGGTRFDATTPEDYQAQVTAYGQQLSQYRNFDIDIDIPNDKLNIGTCGTPHVEIYGPDQMLLIGDSCKDGHKDGLAYLKKWIADET